MSGLLSRGPITSTAWLTAQPVLTQGMLDLSVREVRRRTACALSRGTDHICSTVNLHNQVWFRGTDGRYTPQPVLARGMLE